MQLEDQPKKSKRQIKNNNLWNEFDPNSNNYIELKTQQNQIQNKQINFKENSLSFISDKTQHEKRDDDYIPEENDFNNNGNDEGEEFDDTESSENRDKSSNNYFLSEQNSYENNFTTQSSQIKIQNLGYDEIEDDIQEEEKEKEKQQNQKGLQQMDERNQFQNKVNQQDKEENLILLLQNGAKLNEKDKNYVNFFNKYKKSSTTQKRVFQFKEKVGIEQIIYTFYIEYIINHMSRYFSSKDLKYFQNKFGQNVILNFQIIKEKFIKGGYTYFREIVKDFNDIIKQDQFKGEQIDIENQYYFDYKFQYNEVSKKCLKILKEICDLSGKSLKQQFFINQNEIPYAMQYEDWTDEQLQEYLFVIQLEIELKEKFICLATSWLSKDLRSQFFQYIIDKKPRFYNLLPQDHMQ